MSVTCRCALVAGVATGGALCVVRAPLLAAAVIGSAALLGFAIVGARWLPTAFLTLLMVVLGGYACLGRSFAYLGSPPVFVGELTLLCGLAASLFSRRLLTVVRQPAGLMMLALMLWGAARTVPYFDAFGMDALRDAVLWGYSAFAIVVAACLLATNRVHCVVATYRRFAPWYVVWVPLAVAAAELLGDGMPNLPGTGVPIITAKLGDMGVHLAGVGAFVFVHQSTTLSTDGKQWASARWRTFWIVWLAALLCVLAKSRGGFVAVAAALSVVALLDPWRTGRRLILVAMFVLILGWSVVMAVVGADGSTHRDDSGGRQLTPAQIVANLSSLWKTDNDDALSRTRQWRLDWWDSIVGYTFAGPYFWTGKGFGLNLADDDGFQVSSFDDAPLRSPHNGHLTMLARAGVPGLTLWILFQLSFAVTVGRAYPVRTAACRMGMGPHRPVDPCLLDGISRQRVV